MNYLQWFNLFEAVLWFSIAVAVPFIRLADRKPDGPSRSGLTPGRRIGLVLTLLIFGISDLIEIKSGSWWSPWWLFLLKAGCILSFFMIIWRIASPGRKIN